MHDLQRQDGEETFNSNVQHTLLQDGPLEPRINVVKSSKRKNPEQEETRVQPIYCQNG
ncbi:Hypothetical protein FKW44_003755 [Caligus rogercresseyi]|uniref:Uncharacterized protein n=1 Tax=Caligus rogercresseyi TaxID=217165 RepID=A0A7T8KM69_CALRO|nr:Hypothetical protein FKW44_003755 [Caligus rogercresseyi]